MKDSLLCNSVDSIIKQSDYFFINKDFKKAKLGYVSALDESSKIRDFYIRSNLNNLINKKLINIKIRVEKRKRIPNFILFYGSAAITIIIILSMPGSN